MPNACSTPRSTSTGSEAPPDAASFSAQVSNRSRSGTASSAMYIVGTPRKTVTRSAGHDRQRLLAVELRQQGQAGSAGHRRVQAHGLAEGVEQRQPAEDHVARGPSAAGSRSWCATLLPRLAWVSSAPLG